MLSRVSLCTHETDCLNMLLPLLLITAAAKCSGLGSMVASRLHPLPTPQAADVADGVLDMAT